MINKYNIYISKLSECFLWCPSCIRKIKGKEFYNLSLPVSRKEV